MADENRLLGVTIADESLLEQAQTLAQQLGLELLDTAPEGEGLLLRLTPEHLELRLQGPDAPGPVFVDFIEGAMGHRRRFGGGRGQLVAKAVGIKKERIPTVVDATAGLGRDSFILAQLGCRVHMMERSPVVAALLADGMARACMDAEVAPVIENMTLETGDAAQLLLQLSEDARPDVVYVDPMHPERTKAALVKKEMRLFRALVGGDEDDSRLLESALQVARRRVVVKRPRKAEAIVGPKPGLVMEGKSTRYDIYLVG